MKNTISTFRLKKWGNNTLVYAKSDKSGKASPVTYGNRTQATKKMIELQNQGVDCYIYQGHNFYVAITENKTNTYTLEHKLCESNPNSSMPDEIWSAVFSFNAVDEKEANEKAYKWARYHSFSGSDVRVRPATAHEAEYWLHNEWVN